MRFCHYIMCYYWKGFSSSDSSLSPSAITSNYHFNLLLVHCQPSAFFRPLLETLALRLRKRRPSAFPRWRNHICIHGEELLLLLLEFHYFLDCCEYDIANKVVIISQEKFPLSTRLIDISLCSMYQSNDIVKRCRVLLTVSLVEIDLCVVIKALT